MSKKHHKLENNEEEIISDSSSHHFVKKSLSEEVSSEKSKKSQHLKLDDTKKITSNSEMQKKLVEIYENHDGSMPDMKNFTKVKRSKLIGAFSTLLFSTIFLITAVWVSLFVLKPSNSFSAKDVSLTIVGENNVTFGQVVNYKIEYKNTGNVPLAMAELQVKYPEGFSFKESSLPATTDRKDTWNLGTVDPGMGGSINIKGLIYGGKDEGQSFRVFLNYTPSNFNSEFQKVETLIVQVSEPLVNLVLTGPSDTAVGENAEFHILLNSTSTLSNALQIRVEPSVNFSKKDSNPVADNNESYHWTFTGLKEKKDITLKGSFSKETDGALSTIKVMVFGWKGEKKLGEPYKLSETIQTVRLTESGVQPLLVINGSTDKLAVAPGDILNTSFSIKNTGSTAIKNAKIRFVIEVPAYQQKSALNWTKLDDKNNGTVTGENVGDNARRGVIEWTIKQIPGLANIKPGAELSLDLSIPIKTTEETNWSNYTINGLSAVVEMEYPIDTEKQIVRSNPITMTLNSDLGLEVRDTVTSDEQSREVHTVTWLLTNNYHELKNVQVEADVYGDVTWKEDALTVPAGKATYDSKNKKIVWTIDTMPTDVDVLGLQFTIVLNKKNPSQSNLTSKVRIKALDTVTNNEIIKVGEEVLLGGMVGN